jgi:hypothetical protein
MLLFSACGSGGSDAATSILRPSASSPAIHVPPGPPPKTLVIKDIKKGKGVAVPPISRRPRVELTALFTAVKYENGELYKEWQNPDVPYEVEFGPGLNEGLENGLTGMRVGGRRELIVPGSMTVDDVPLVYVFDLLRVKTKKAASGPGTKKLSKAEIAKLPKLTIPKASGPPPRHLEVIDLRKGGSGPAVTKADTVSIRFLEDTYPEALKGVQGGLGGGEVGPLHYPLSEASRGSGWVCRA